MTDLHIYPSVQTQSFDLYGNGLKLLAERLRKNWMQKLTDSKQTDDSLTSLTWLYNANPITLEVENNQKVNEIEIKSDFLLLDNRAKNVNEHQPFAGSLLDPQVRLEYRTKWTGKPPFSYATLICLAMRELGKPKVTLSDIYGWIMHNFSYYRHTDSSWQNSVRHNLSLNKCFEKVPRDKGERGKGGFWRVNPRHIDWLEANLAKCRRAAPPPGPPPPMPRSMLLQQHQMQQYKCQSFLVQQQQNMSTAASSSAVAVAATTFSVPNPDWTHHHHHLHHADVAKSSRISAFSPSSNSSLSSSPLSFTSVGSPAHFLSNKISITTANSGCNNSASGGGLTTTNAHVYHAVGSSDNANLTLPNITSTSISTPTNNSIPNRRRKSPLLEHTSYTQLTLDDCGQSMKKGSIWFGSDHEYDDYDDGDGDSDIEEEQQHHRHLPSVHQSKSDWTKNKYSKEWYKRTDKSSAVGTLPSLKTRRQTIVGSSQRSVGILQQQLAADKCDVVASGNKRVAKSKLVAKSNSDVKLMPTRILPPRRRYSRWAHPRPEHVHHAENIQQDDSNKLSENHIVDYVPNLVSKGRLETFDATPNKTPLHQQHVLDSVGNRTTSANDLAKTHLSPFFDYLDEKGDYCWPPIEESAQDHRSFTPPSSTKSAVILQAEPLLPQAAAAVASASNYYGRNQNVSFLSNINLSTYSSNESFQHDMSFLSSLDQTNHHHHHESPDDLKWTSLPSLSDDSGHLESDEDMSASGDCKNHNSTMFIHPTCQQQEDEEEEEEEELRLFTDQFMNSDLGTDDKLLNFVDFTEPQTVVSQLSSSSTTITSTVAAAAAMQSSELFQTLTNNGQTKVKSPLLNDLELDGVDLNFDALDPNPMALDMDFALTANFGLSHEEVDDNNGEGQEHEDDPKEWRNNSGKMDYNMSSSSSAAAQAFPANHKIQMSAKNRVEAAADSVVSSAKFKSWTELDFDSDDTSQWFMMNHSTSSGFASNASLNMFLNEMNGSSLFDESVM